MTSSKTKGAGASVLGIAAHCCSNKMLKSPTLKRLSIVDLAQFDGFEKIVATEDAEVL